jgi:hypothetical protein
MKDTIRRDTALDLYQAMALNNRVVTYKDKD